SYSGRGISIFKPAHNVDAQLYWDQAAAESPTHEALIEEYIQGDLYSFSAFIENNSVIQYFIVREGSSSNPYAVDTSFVVHQPSSHLVAQLSQGVEKISRTLKLTDGLFHLQYILKNDEPYFIEATRRCPGDLYSLLIEYSTGFEYAAKFASYFTNRSLETTKKHCDHVIRHTITSLQSCIYRGLNFKISLDVMEFFPLLRVGEFILERQKNRAGILFVKTESSEKQEAIYEAFMSRRAYSVE
ncbi:hypothetical protein ACF0BG_19425, partial [Acinetobacter baumannii]